MIDNHYYKLYNGKLVSKFDIEAAVALVEAFDKGAELVALSDNELFCNENVRSVDAVIRFRKKYSCSLLEAKAAIEFLRGRDE